VLYTLLAEHSPYILLGGIFIHAYRFFKASSVADRK